MTQISDIFGKSPFPQLQDHIELVTDCVKLLTPFFESLVGKDLSRANDLYDQIAAAEVAADEAKKALRQSLTARLFLPVQRQDLLKMVTVQDRLANRARDIAGLCLGREMTIPDTIQGQFMALVNRTVEATAHTRKLVGELDELVETGFRGREAKLVEEMIEKLGEIESEIDRLVLETRKALFKIERDLPPIDVMFLYRIVETLGEIGDEAQSVGGTLQLLISR